MANTGFAGEWETDFGRMTLTVDGVLASGRFGDHGGTVEGIAAGRVLNGKWRQNAAGGFGVSWGDFSLTLDGLGQRFTGTWTYRDDHAPGGGTWTGRRIG
jgi:hypothetical protein